MYINIDEIKEPSLSLRYSKKVTDFPAIEEMVAKGECDFISPIDIRLNVKRNITVVEVKGTVETKVRLQCSRCLEAYEASVRPDFSLTFVPEEPEDPEDPDRSLDDEIELSTYDMQVVSFSGEMLEFQEPVQEQLVLALLEKHLCRESCKGLCYICGANLNEVSCSCETGYINPQFDSLKNLKLDK
jgi:uncharacterized protein